MLGVIISDTGKKQYNQDSACYRILHHTNGLYVMAAVCDGMGGYEGGGHAGNLVINALSWWFDHAFVKLPESYSLHDIREALSKQIVKTNQMLVDYKKRNDMNAGTTLSCLMITPEGWLSCQVGDSRIYSIGSKVEKLTEDQSFAYRELKSGRMTQEEIDRDPRKNMLLQCIGITEEIYPVFHTGTMRNLKGYLLCSDGFWHTVTEDEMDELFLNACRIRTEDMSLRVNDLVRSARIRGESDDVTAVVLWNTEAVHQDPMGTIRKSEVFGIDK